MRWLRGWLRLGGWKYRAAAQKKQELLARDNPQAVALGLSLMDALFNRKNICKRCHTIYIPREYDFPQRFAVRSILHIQDSLPNPMFCDYCFNSIQQEYNRFQNNVGTSNSGPPNLALKHLIAKE
jgi:hypothetical protein